MSSATKLKQPNPPPRATIPFFSVAGSTFVEIFVGVGAAWVRDRFSEDGNRAPGDHRHRRDGRDRPPQVGLGCRGRQRRAGADPQPVAGRDGRFDVPQEIAVLAASNRPEVLNPALLRPGRLDPQVTIPLPTLVERAAIFAVHC